MKKKKKKKTLDFIRCVFLNTQSICVHTKRLIYFVHHYHITKNIHSFLNYRVHIFSYSAMCTSGVFQFNVWTDWTLVSFGSLPWIVVCVSFSLFAMLSLPYSWKFSVCSVLNIFKNFFFLYSFVIGFYVNCTSRNCISNLKY